MDLIEKQNRVLAKQYQKLKETRLHMMNLLIHIILERQIETREHMSRVGIYSGILASSYAELYPDEGITKRQIALIAETSQMHDVGKLTMPDALLRKAGKLSGLELNSLMEHTQKGSEIMKMFSEVSDEEYSRIGCNICKYHHARYDGSGYPKNVSGKQIPIEAQLVSLADMYDVLVNEPINNHIHSKEEAYRMLISGECGELAPRMKKCFETVREEMEAVSESI